MSLRPVQKLLGDGLMARAARSSAIVFTGYGVSQALRLASNLILTRLLFPEAFGMMTLISVILIGLTLFSDIGISPSISQSKRGDDPAFLDTAYSLQAIRGVGLWLAACLLAYPASLFYDAPDLLHYLPVASFAMVIIGLNTTRIYTAYRHLQLGRVTFVDVAAHVIQLVVIVLLAWMTRSVWALVVGDVIYAIAHLVLAKTFLAGHRNRFGWEKAAAHELIHFGKWIFISTVFNFFAQQGDKLVLGKYFSLGTLGIYNIGYYFGTFPLVIAREIVNRVLIPVYRDVAEDGSPESARRLIQMRYAMTGSLMAMLILLAISGHALINTLYDARYITAGAMLVLIAAAMMPEAIGISYDRAALAAGDSKRFFVISAARGTFGVLALLIGVHFWGAVGAIAGIGAAGLLLHPFLIWLAVKHRVWDPVHDLLFFSIAATTAILAVWWNLDEIHHMIATAKVVRPE